MWISSLKQFLPRIATISDVPWKVRSLCLIDRASFNNIVSARRRVSSARNESPVQITSFSPLAEKCETRFLFQFRLKRGGPLHICISPKMSNSWLNSIRRVKQTTTSMRFAFHLRFRERGRLDNPPFWDDFRLTNGKNFDESTRTFVRLIDKSAPLGVTLKFPIVK